MSVLSLAVSCISTSWSAVRTKLYNNERRNACWSSTIRRQAERVQLPPPTGNAGRNRDRFPQNGKKSMAFTVPALLQMRRTIAPPRMVNTRTTSNATSTTIALMASRRKNSVRTGSCSIRWIARSISAITSSTSTAAIASNYVRSNK